MPLVLNATKEVQSFKVHGAWFVLKPDQSKLMDEDKARFISMERKENGLAVLPAEFEDPEYRATEEGKALLDRLKKEAVDSYVEFHRDIIRNNQISLRQDLAKANEKADPAIYASEGEVKAMELVAKYQEEKNDSEQKKIDRIKELMTQVGQVAK